MKVSSIFASLLILFFISNLPISAIAQTDKGLLSELVKEEQETVNALVLYPEEIRTAILNASLHPEALIKMESIQTRSSTAFKTLMEPHPQSIQKMIWNLTRYPDLVHKLAITDNQSMSDIQSILKNYSEVVHPSAKQAVQDYHPLLIEIDELHQEAESAFEFILNDYSLENKEALQQLITLPEVLTVLTENIRLTILVGDLYRKEPQWLRHKADSLHLVVARQNAKELEDWKSSLENNAEAIEELKKSGDSYNQEYGYDDVEYDHQKNVDDLYYDEEGYERPDEIIIRQHYSYNYPYWFGCPYWYEYPRWRNYPYWYDWGFYISPQRTIVVFGLPSYHFTHWYFYHPHHHSYWPNLSTHFVNHYYGHREFGGSVTSSVRIWRNQNKEIITDQWLQNDGKMPNRFKEYGKFETERVRFNQKNPRKAISQKKYVEQNKRRYPELSKSIKESKNDNVVRNKIDRTIPVNPRIKNSAIDKPRVVKPKKNIGPIRKKEKTSSRKPFIPKVNKAKDYHKNIWEKSKRKGRVIKKSKNRKTVPKMRKNTRTPRKIKPRKKSNG